MDIEKPALKVTVTEENATIYKQRALDFDRIFPEQKANFSTSTDLKYYLVSCKFIKEWRVFCTSNQLEREEPSSMNSDLVDPESASVKLKENLVESADFQIVNQDVYKLFQGFPVTIELKREAYIENGEKRVPIYLRPISYIMFKQVDLQNIDRKRITLKNLNLKEINSLSGQNTVEDLLQTVKENEKVGKNYSLRAWVSKKENTMEVLFKHIALQCAPLPYYNMKIKGVGKCISSSETNVKIGELNLEEGDYFIIECAEYEKWFFRSPDESKCEGCFEIGKLSHFCGCKKAGYCSEACQEKDKAYHQRFCNFAEEEELNKKIQMVMTPQSLKGLVGLTNLGNTCFMNSCLQCLSHTLPLTSYFLGSYYEPEINKTNPLGTKGKLAKAYATFIKNMWCESNRTYSPYRLKAAIASVNPMFSGYAQHDSQELFSFLVDGLHEDLNRVHQKPYVESVQSNNRPDEIVARESWVAHTQRNQSIIVDTMTGQYKSKVICPDCKKQSITFDPFITVTLPIPEEATSSELSYFILFKNNEEPTKRMSFSYRKADVNAWLEEATQMLGRSKQEFKFYILSFNENIYSFSDTPKSELIHKIEVEDKQAFLIELTPEEQAMENRLELVVRMSKKAKWSRSYESLWFKKPYFFDRDSTTGETVYKKILKYLYHDTYDRSTFRYHGEGSGKTYEEYEEYMMKNRPFTLYLRYGKSIESFYHRIQTKFENQVEIEDAAKISELLQKQKQGDFEIDARFNEEGLEQFSPERLRNFVDSKKKKKSFIEQKSTVTLDQCFEVFEEPEQLEKGNQWYCSSCQQHKLATKQLTIYKAPQVLILHLKRFKSKGIIRKEKNDTNVSFPLELDLTPYVIDPKPINSYIPYLKSEGKLIEPSYKINVNQNSEPKYELYAISNHYGGLGGGHYTAYAKNNQKWYNFNDSSVSATSPEQMRTEGAYILFYKRIAHQ